MNKGTLVVVSGFSGAGKGTVLSQVFQRRPDLYFSVSFTTRAPRTTTSLPGRRLRSASTGENFWSMRNTWATTMAPL